jgi:hypothetical protein
MARARDFAARSISFILALIAAKLYTEEQTVYSFLYSLREFIGSFAPEA